MKTLVMKFGGAAVASPEKFACIADIIVEKKRLYDRIVVVVSAMGNTTNQLLELALQVHPTPPRREQDMLVSVGERISIALLAMALHKKGEVAISFTGSQSGIITTSEHSDAKIVDVKPHRIHKALGEGKIVIVAGFQGVSREGEITTLGRGGSDTSAVALAAALFAEKVEFYKDVGGVYSEDPKKNRRAVHYPRMSYQEAADLMEKGAKVLHLRAVQLAEKNHIALHVLSFSSISQEHALGTWICGPSEKSKVEKVAFEVGNNVVK